jgi:hypothetical protein
MPGVSIRAMEHYVRFQPAHPVAAGPGAAGCAALSGEPPGLLNPPSARGAKPLRNLKPNLMVPALALVRATTKFKAVFGESSPTMEEFADWIRRKGGLSPEKI